jgi:hypothetical protein
MRPLAYFQHERDGLSRVGSILVITERTRTRRIFLGLPNHAGLITLCGIIFVFLGHYRMAQLHISL